MGRRPAKVLDLDMSFDEALERFIRVDPTEMPRPSPGAKKPAPRARSRKAPDIKKADRPAKPKPTRSSLARPKRGKTQSKSRGAESKA